MGISAFGSLRTAHELQGTQLLLFPRSTSSLSVNSMVARSDGDVPTCLDSEWSETQLRFNLELPYMPLPYPLFKTVFLALLSKGNQICLATAAF